MKAAVLPIALLFCASAQRPELSDEQRLLKGLRSVDVAVEISVDPRFGPDHPDVITIRKMGKMIKPRIVTRLHRVGIIVDSKAPTCIQATVNVMRRAHATFGYKIELELQERVVLARDRAIRTVVSTWQKSDSGIGSANDISEAVNAMIDEFMADCLAARKRNRRNAAPLDKLDRPTRHVDQVVQQRPPAKGK